MTVEEPGSEGDTGASSPGAMVRTLLRSVETGALATTLVRDGSGAPYASLVLLACDHAARPLMLLSDLADHSRNLAVDPHLSLLVDGHAPEDEPLTGARASVQGRAEIVTDESLRNRFLARHPSAAAYAEFADFKLYRIEPSAAHLVAGFGRIHWLTADSLLFDTAEFQALAEAEADILAHMNQDHGDAIDLIANRLLGLGGGDWVLTGIDPEGFDLRRERRLGRGTFASLVTGPESCRKELVRLTQEARQTAT